MCPSFGAINALQDPLAESVPPGRTTNYALPQPDACWTLIEMAAAPSVASGPFFDLQQPP